MSTLRTFRRYWLSLRLPWRKKYLVGEDLNGNTYWEFRERMHAHRPRRIVEFNQKVGGFEEVKVSPAWHQWLRATRMEAPTIQEQIDDLRRIEELKVRAKLADERWEAKGRIVGGQGEGGTTRIPIAGQVGKDVKEKEEAVVGGSR